MTAVGDYVKFRSFIDKSITGTVAQSVEQRTENPRVGGSIPSRPTTLRPLEMDTYRLFVSVHFSFQPCRITGQYWTITPVSPYTFVTDWTISGQSGFQINLKNYLLCLSDNWTILNNLFLQTILNND